MTNKYFFHHINSRFFKISGQDSETFIQNLITNDITKCEINDIIYSCLLTPQGRFIGDFFIFKQDKNNLYTFSSYSLDGSFGDRNVIPLGVVKDYFQLS